MLAGSPSAIQCCRAPSRTELCTVGSVAQIILGPAAWTPQVAMGLTRLTIDFGPIA
jgi:hypothetical protein